jgi:hypothetical protein
MNTLLAEDAEDLQILSARLQDATARLKELVWMPGKHRFAAVFNRFRCPQKRGDSRVRARLHIDGVLKVQSQKLKHGAPDAVVSLLAITFTPGEAPGGVIELVFAGGGALKLTVECIEAGLRDLTGPWAASARPDHAEGR